jgi:hypothetical protein
MTRETLISIVAWTDIAIGLAVTCAISCWAGRKFQNQWAKLLSAIISAVLGLVAFIVIPALLIPLIFLIGPFGRDHIEETLRPFATSIADHFWISIVGGIALGIFCTWAKFPKRGQPRNSKGTS